SIYARSAAKSSTGASMSFPSSSTARGVSSRPDYPASMATVAEALQSQLRNIEASTGRTIDDWVELIRSSGRSRHGEIVPWLKAEHGLRHGTAHRLALTAIDRLRAAPAPRSLEDALYPEARR